MAFARARHVAQAFRSICHVASAEELKRLSPPQAAPVLVFFTAAWCQPCRSVLPHLEDISDRFEGPHLKLAQVDVSDSPEAAREFRVEAVPYFLVLRDGHVVERLAGDGPKELAEVAERHAAAFEKLQEESR
ncbi:unnamed protein product [Effrenium voratum]|uniref:Thioredoxin domain-containing protein n=1 Tax=Effrenium voratum TaxID=2562239 RepID=A0AA36INZ8_9DINO|nr:unnamed protein product [Effrenium voratum]CAJ1390240.1 unnamed protein product [Effrenium voratum]CAJ1448376.1 unnamed protein product [Effrenium voratum]